MADDHEVAADRAEHVARLARPGHRDRLLGRDGDRTLSGVPGGGGHLEHVLRRRSVPARARRGPPGPRPGRSSGSRRPGSRGRPRRCWPRSGRRAPSRGRSGSTSTSCAPVCSIAARIIPVDGRLPGPPCTTTAPASSNRLASPGPAATATIARPVRARGAWPATWSAKWVTRIRCGRPALMPASIAAPTSSTWTWTFQSPSPPTTTSESPSPPSVVRSGAHGLVRGVEQVHHLVRRSAGHEVAARRFTSGCGMRCGPTRPSAASGR